MIRLKEKSKVYIYAPSNFATGGAELLHQLVHVLRQKSVDAYIVYFDYLTKSLDSKNNISNTPKEYLKYNISVSEYVEDEEDNVIVFYEGIFYKSLTIEKSQIVLWWLSVDHFFLNDYNFKNLSFSDYWSWNKKLAIKVLIKRFSKLKYSKSTYSLKKLKSKSTINCYQSIYAQNFLINNGFHEILPLSDYINKDFFDKDLTTAQRFNNILYNPKKGIKSTKKLISLRPDLNWIPLINMTRAELSKLMLKSKIYIDFGYHPGKDRFAREAASCGCCVITNKKGSANFYEDVSIHSEYKFDKNNPKKILNCIDEIINKYESHIDNFSFYRERILREETLFNDEVEIVFNL